ncbi:MAG: anthranilate phosphoribosyltransferase [Saprospiraceae bacterium]|nr:anthranilate phosphoribosyltransferase [Saprospiraceae bacterium]
MKTILEYLFAGNILSREEAKNHLVDIAQERHPLNQVASFVTVYRMRPITIPELQGFRDALLSLRVPVDLEGRDTIDIVGTGGDGKNTFNISTTTAFVIAGAGYPVTKHGSYGVSSHCGSSNVLMELGIEFSNDQETLLRQLDTAGICFFHAPLFHPAMKAVVPLRKELKVKTFFNMLGPLTNPAQPKYQLFGTYSKQLAKLYDAMLKAEDKNYTVVYAVDGYDEVSLTGDSLIFQPTGKRILSPESFGAQTVDPQSLHGGENVAEAKTILLGVLQGSCSPEQKAVVLANAALAIQTWHPEKSLTDCLGEARESLDSGKAFAALQAIIESTVQS